MIRADETREAIGRYQLVEAAGLVFLLDTTSGRVWSRDYDGQWYDEGNPTRNCKPRRVVARDQAQELPQADPYEVVAPPLSEPVEITLYQRNLRELPGSKGTVLIRVADITDGQTLLSVVDANGAFLLEQTSVSQGEEVEFSVGDSGYTVRVKEMRNLLTGNDFATLVVSEGRLEESDEADESVAAEEADEEAELIE